jgi:alanine racemase
MDIVHRTHQCDAGLVEPVFRQPMFMETNERRDARTQDTIVRSTVALIDLEAYAHNVRVLRAHIPAHIDMLAVVKANAYGHGAVHIAQEAQRCGVRMLGVALLTEALALRAQGITMPILILGITPTAHLDCARRARVAVTMCDVDAVRAIPDDDVPLIVHLKVDTGMGRIGATTVEEVVAAARAVHDRADIVWEGLYTHYARADEADASYSAQQHARFVAVCDAIRAHGMPIPLVHAANTAIALTLPAYAQQMVRLGIGTYGVYPSAHTSAVAPRLRPVLSWETRIVAVKTVGPDTPISYGGRYVTSDSETIATLPVGYADGLSRKLSGRWHVVIQGQYVPIVGTICMDMCMVRIPPSMYVRVGERVVLIGRMGDAHIAVDDVACALDTIPYEVLCGISDRVPRLMCTN